MATRYRCKACGNLTRFDVTKMTRTREFHHFKLADSADYAVDEREVLEEVVEKVACRWCANGGEIEFIEIDESEVTEDSDTA